MPLRIQRVGTPSPGGSEYLSMANCQIGLPQKADDDCRTELRWIYDRWTREEARQDLAAWLSDGGRGIRSCAAGWKKTWKKRGCSMDCHCPITTLEIDQSAGTPE